MKGLDKNSILFRFSFQTLLVISGLAKRGISYKYMTVKFKSSEV